MSGLNYGNTYHMKPQEWNNKEGVFQGANGKYLVRIRKRDGNKTYCTISQHIKESDAIEAFDNYKNK